MAHISNILDELRTVRTFLLSPSNDVLWDCESRLAQVIQVIRKSGERYVQSLELKSLIQDIHLLLESARKFWDMRQFTIRPGQQYSATGSLLPAHRASTFVIEI